VRPNLGLVVKCPRHIEEDRINLFLKRKWMWLNKQIRFFEKFKRIFYKREYISGESFLYLGRQYQLIVKQSNQDKVSLLKGKLMVFTNSSVSDGSHNKKLIEDWYKKI
ncbi:Putative predicted metal-dependent hydrolase, partial [hydrothermal vent metagenome]